MKLVNVIAPPPQIRKETAQITTDVYGIGWTAYDLTNCITIQINSDSTSVNTRVEKIKSPSANFCSGIIALAYNGSPVASATLNVDFYFLDI